MKVENDIVKMEYKGKKDDHLMIDVLKLVREAIAHKLTECQIILPDANNVKSLVLYGDHVHIYPTDGFNTVNISVLFNDTDGTTDISIGNQCRHIKGITLKKGNFNKVTIDSWLESSESTTYTLDGFPPSYNIGHFFKTDTLIYTSTAKGTSLTIFPSINILLTGCSYLVTHDMVNHIILLNPSCNLGGSSLFEQSVYGRTKGMYMFGDKAIDARTDIVTCINLNDLYPKLYAENIDDDACSICI